MQAVYDTLKGDTGFHEGSDLIVHWDAVMEADIPPPSNMSPSDDRIRRWAWVSEIRHTNFAADQWLSLPPVISFTLAGSAATGCPDRWKC